MEGAGGRDGYCLLNTKAQIFAFWTKAVVMHKSGLLALVQTLAWLI